MRQNGRESNEIRTIKIQNDINDNLPAALLVSNGDTKIYITVNTVTGNDIQISGNDLSGNVHCLSWITTWLKNTLYDQFKKFNNCSLLITYTILADDGSLKATCFNGIILALAQINDDFDIKQLPVAISVGNTLNGNVKVDLENNDLATLNSALTMIVDANNQISNVCQNAASISLDAMTTLLTTGIAAAKQRRQQMTTYLQQTLMPYQNLHLDNDTVVISTHNLNKTREYRAMFAKKGLQVKTLNDFPNLPTIRENGQTFEENARLKADKIANLLNLPVLADDSGLMVDALNGRPGIFSARFAKDHDDAANNAKLLRELANIPDDCRTATFHTTIVLAKPHRPTDDLVVQGELHGFILDEPRGNDGFGYDPLFYVPKLGKTLAQLTPDQKNAISHRGNAMRKLAQIWPQWWHANN